MKTKNLKKKLAAMAMSIIMACSVVGGITASATKTIDFDCGVTDKPIWGDNRYETSLQAAFEVYKQTSTKYSTVIIASGLSYADALSASYLSVQKNAPILFTSVNNNTADTNLKKFLGRYAYDNCQVFIIGGTGVISDTTEKMLKTAQNYSVTRLAGSDRYTTNRYILDKTNAKNADKILICDGTNFPDALSASATQYPIMLASKNGLTEAQKNYLKTTKKNFVIIGGTGAVTTTVESQLKSISSNVSRIAGSNRYETCQKVATQLISTNPTKWTIVSGSAFPDALSGSYVARKNGTPLILAQETTAQETTYNHSSGSSNSSENHSTGYSKTILNFDMLNKYYSSLSNKVQGEIYIGSTASEAFHYYVEKHPSVSCGISEELWSGGGHNIGYSSVSSMNN